MNLGERICIKLLRSAPSDKMVRDLSMGKEGRVRFKVPVTELCSTDTRLKNSITRASDLSELEPFHVDMIGELVVRKNLASFINLLASMSNDDYNQKLLLFNHLHFSIQKVESSIEITFHISFLHDVLIEKFVSQVEKGP